LALFGGDIWVDDDVNVIDNTLTVTRIDHGLSYPKGWVSAATVNNMAFFGGGMNRNNPGYNDKTVDCFNSSLSKSTC
jgi:hypothetical protein